MSVSAVDPFALQKSIETLVKCCLRMAMDCETVCLACQYLHRFSTFFDADLYDTDLMAATALYLAAKVTENHVKIKDIIMVFYEQIHKKMSPFENDYKLYACMKESIIDCELLLIRMLKFKVDKHLPHRFLNIYLQTLFRWMGDATKAGQLESACWPLVNDYLCLDRRSLNHRPNQIAIAVIELALRSINYKIPYNDEAIRTWEEAFDEDLSKHKMEEIIDQIISVYDNKDSHSDRSQYAPQKVFHYKS